MSCETGLSESSRISDIQLSADKPLTMPLILPGILTIEKSQIPKSEYSAASALRLILWLLVESG